jgi:hypothetical protein
VLAFAVFDDGTGPALYAGGAFHERQQRDVEPRRALDGSGWAALGSGTPGYDSTRRTVFDDGDGPALYAAGARTGLDAPVLRWDGTSWSSVGGGFSSDVYALATIDDGSGAGALRGRLVPTADGVAARSIARWDGASWSPLGAGLGSSCHALAQFHDDGGRALLAGGTSTRAPPGTASSRSGGVVRRTVRTP